MLNKLYYETIDPVYGVQIDFINNTYTRIQEAVGKTAVAGFDDIPCWGGRRRCNLADNGTVNAYYGDAGYVENGSNGQVMVEQPKFWYRVEPLIKEADINNKGYILRKANYFVSSIAKSGFKVHPAFIQNGVEKDKIYLSAYEGSVYDVSASAYILNDAQTTDFTATTGDKLCSISGAKPVSGLTQNLTRRNAGILAENRGTGWCQAYAATVSATQLLFIIEYAHMNSQQKIGLGVANKASGTGNESEITGGTASLGNATGIASGTNGLVSITYRGEENFWSNIFKFVDGMNIYCNSAITQHDLFIADNGFTESKNTAPYVDAGITLAMADGYISAFAYNEDFDWLFVPAETLGDKDVPVGDYFYQAYTTTGYKIARLGGYWASGVAAGSFSWIVNGAPSARIRLISARLVYVPN